MRKLTLLLCLVFAAGLAFADEKAAEKPKAEKAAKAAAEHDVAVEVVSVDAAKNTITIKSEKGEATVPVEGKAVASLKSVKAGQKVTVTCKDEGTEHKSVTAIKAAAAEKSEKN